MFAIATPAVAQIFPAPTPVADPNPAIHHTEIAKVGTRLEIKRTADSLSISADRAHLTPVTLQVGSKMMTGLETRLFVYPKVDQWRYTPPSAGWP